MKINLPYILGAAAVRSRRWLLSRTWFPLYRTFLLGAEWPYDICRFAGTRDLRTIFDVGANIGQTALYLRPFFPHAHIHCFELVAHTAELCRRNTAGIPNITVHPVGLSREPGIQRVQLQGWSELNSLRYAASSDAAVQDTEIVKLTTADAIAADTGIEHIDIFKIDAQAFDLEVLRGAQRLLSTNQISFIYTEITFDSSQRDCQFFQPLHDFVSVHGFSLCHLYEQWNAGPALQFCNALYVNPGALERNR